MLDAVMDFCSGPPMENHSGVDRISISASVGVKTSSQHNETADDLIKAADLALYRAKAAGRRCYVLFTPEMGAESTARQQLHETIRDAMQNERFELHFQPICCAKSRSLVGFEALLRLPTHAGGFIPPSVFIPVAEQIGLIVDIGAWVIRRACEMAATWPAHLTVAVNLSAEQFKTGRSEEGRVKDVVSCALAASGLDPHRLELEVTESLLLETTEDVIAELHHLKNLGVTLVMDDFGTGYSSLSYLWRLPLDKIKIDRSFVAACAESRPKINSILESITALGHLLGMQVTAEGVETAEQAAYCSQLSCDHMQGYLFGRPLPASEIAAAILKDYNLPMLSIGEPQRALAAASSAARRAPACDQELLDVVWESLNVARDNKALVLAKDGTTLNINTLASHLCGRSQKELMGKSVTTELFEDAPAQNRGAGSQRWETALKTVSDGPIAVEVVRQPLGRLEGVEVYAIRDLRERREAAEERDRQNRALQQREEELRVQNAKLDTALKTMSQGLATFDAEERIVVANDHFAEIHGMTRDQVKPGTTLRQIIEIGCAKGIYPGRTVEDVLNSTRQSRAQNKVSHVTRTQNDGRTIAVSIYPGADGSWVTTHQDVTGREKLAAQLAEQKQQLDVALNNMSQGLCLFDANQRVVVANRRYADMYDLPLDLIQPGTTLRQIMEARAGKGHYDNDSAKQWVETGLANFHKEASDVLPLSDGRFISVLRRLVAGGGLVSTHEDVTEREKLRERLDAALNNMVHGLAMFDAELRLVLANERYTEIYGLEPEQVKPGMHLREIVEHRIAKGHYGAKTVDEVLDPMLARATGRDASHHVSELPDGRFIAVSVQPMANGGKVTTHHDITEQRRSEAKIAHMALHDTLTGLPNRALLNERLEQALARRGEIVAIHILDLDHFKHVNDTLGHPVGDKLLQMVGDRLRLLIRETDTIARMGGDEFAIVQVALSQVADATSLAQRVIAALCEPYDIGGHHVVIGTSVGIAMGPSDGLVPNELVRNADLALYRAKSDGRGTFRFFEPEMDAQMQARRVLEHDLRKALIAGEFELHYQPVVDLASDQVSGLEALIRWHHPERGLVSPGAFIPLAEEIGLIIPLGEWSIRQACMVAAQWPEDIKIAVNLSPAQFRSPGLLQVIVGALASSGLAADRLELEITETILLQDSEETLATLYRLRELGVRIAMDDFGTGYSSLSYLQRFPFDKIKIDRSFISNIAESASSLNIVRAVAALANGLGVAATAEGVETKEQLEAIKSEGCTQMQGFLFSRPLPACEVEQLFLSRRKALEPRDGAVAA